MSVIRNLCGLPLIMYKLQDLRGLDLNLMHRKLTVNNDCENRSRSNCSYPIITNTCSRFRRKLRFHMFKNLKNDLIQARVTYFVLCRTSE